MLKAELKNLNERCNSLEDEGKNFQEQIDILLQDNEEKNSRITELETDQKISSQMSKVSNEFMQD
jgi:predicted nuclease with TOPRIM domain